MMSDRKFNWLLPPSLSDEDKQELASISETTQKAGYSFEPAFLTLCWNRGYKDIASILKACDQAPVSLHDPYLFYQMDLAVERIQVAIENDEAILIYGDYDADGITSTLIMKETLESLGANVSYYLPNRFVDGYGPNKDRYEDFIDQGIQLIVTVDNGVAGHEAIDYARSRGVDVIVTDHHEIGQTLPEAYAIIHPRHPQGDYPFKDLCGAGVAFKLAMALLEEIPQELLDLVAIGTVADMVAIQDENRTLVLSGLAMLRTGSRLAIDRLLTIELGQEYAQQVNEDTIGFLISPRLNAVGRLGDPTPGLEWLACYDQDTCYEWLRQINAANQERQALVQKIARNLEDRLAQMDQVPQVIVAGDVNWHPGVLGIVASRMVEKFHRPCLLFFHDREKGEYKGSGRSIEAIDLFQWIDQGREYTKYFGGHSQAAGMTIAEESWEDFVHYLETSVKKYEHALTSKVSVKVDLLISAHEVTINLIEQIKNLGPFGTGNVKPRVALIETQIQDKKTMGADQQHVKLILDGSIEALAFNQSQALAEFRRGDNIDLLGTLSINHWRQKKTPQLNLLDFGLQSTQWIDCRGSQIAQGLMEYSKGLYVFRNKHLAQSLRQNLKETSSATTYDALDQEDLQLFDTLVIMEPPSSIKDLANLWDSPNNSWRKIYLGSYINPLESYYIQGPPQREEFVRLFAYFKTVGQAPLKDLEAIGQSLQISLVKIKTMLVVFFEAKFVKIDNGLIVFEEQTSREKVDLMSMPAMQRYQEAMEAEAFLNYQTMESIRKLCSEWDK